MSEWIKCSEREPDYRVRVLAWDSATGNEVIAFREGVCWFSQDGLSQVPVVTHWQPLPPPPKRESSFEQFWEKIRSLKSEIHPMSQTIRKHEARLVWDAAIAVSKSDDFVP